MSFKMSFPLVLLLLLVAGPATAVIETYKFSSPELEARYQTLSFELRCPKCQNQNIADSNAPIAKDLRNLLHQRLEAGSNDAEITQFMVDRYGEFVLYRPRYSGLTLMLWLAPVLLFVCAGGVVYFLLRRRDTGSAGAAAMSEEDQKRLQNLLGDSESHS